LNFGFSIPSPKSKPQRYTHPSSPIPIKSLWKKVFEFGGIRVQNCPDLQFLRERERETHTHTHTHKHKKFLFRFWSNGGSSSEEHGE
jgi:hypothetical protein